MRSAKEVERRLLEKNVKLSPARVAELTKTMYSISIKIPETNQWETIPFKWTKEQNLIKKSFKIAQGVPMTKTGNSL